MSVATWTNADQRRLMTDRERFMTLLFDEAQLRGQRSRMVHGELEWMTREREAMWRLVDELRRQRGHGTVLIAAVERVESLSAGHVDYAEKFALYCAELASGLRDHNGRTLS